MSPAALLAERARDGLRDRQRHARRELERLLEPLPWWSRPYAWRRALSALLPDVDSARRRLRRYRDYARTREEVEAVLPALDDDLVRGVSDRHKAYPWAVSLRLRLREDVGDAHPALRLLLERGWRVDKVRDGAVGRTWTLERDDRSVSLVVSAYAAGADHCTIVARTVVEERQRYELLCPGEEELVGALDTEEADDGQ